LTELENKFLGFRLDGTVASAYTLSQIWLLWRHTWAVACKSIC